MVVYLDLVFIVNALSDALALYMTARLSGHPIRWFRLLAAALLGGAYGTFSSLPPLAFLGGVIPQLTVAAVMVGVVFGKRETFLRRFLLFFILSCTLGGVLMAFAQYVTEHGAINALQNLNWKVFFLVGSICFFLLSVVFRGGARHAIEGQILKGKVMLDGKSVSVDVLLDTGHTLCDPFTGEPVLTVWQGALKDLFSMDESAILSRVDTMGAGHCAEELSLIAPGRYRLLPYRAVGISAGMLLCFRADEVLLDGKKIGALTVALSPTPVSDGGGYTALWGGKMEGEKKGAA